jgi:hypothetical protein
VGSGPVRNAVCRAVEGPRTADSRFGVPKAQAPVPAELDALRPPYGMVRQLGPGAAMHMGILRIPNSSKCDHKSV